jgi:hypothetical protein
VRLAGKEKKEGTERRVYVLPIEQIERIRAYQTSNGIASEVEAVRRLIDSALQMRDSVGDILNKLQSKFIEEKDLRVLARDILAGHALVKSVHFEDDAVAFGCAGGERGKIDNKGRMYVGDMSTNWDDWETYRPSTENARRPPVADLDDEIPF